MPNPEQLKFLFACIDKLLNNDIESVIFDKISNTEKLAGIIIKILKAIGILFLVYIIISIITVILFIMSIRFSSEIETDGEDNLIKAIGSKYIDNIFI